MTVRLSGKLVCATAGQAELVARYLPTHIALSRASEGCLSFDVTRSDDPLIWFVAETFRDRAAFDAHQIRSRASEWFHKTTDITRVYQVTED